MSVFKKNSLFIAITLFVAFICLESITPFDRFFQDMLFSKDSWLISKNMHEKFKIPLYTLPKVLLLVLGISSFLMSLAMLLRPNFLQKHLLWQKPLLLLALSLALVPLTIAILKNITGIYGPVDLIIYGGQHPHTGLISQILEYGHTSVGRSFPAGHASGGFALMALYFFPLSPALKKAGLALGLAAGWVMGMYQVARGEHFISHNLVSMAAAWIIIMLLAKLLKLPTQIS